MGQCIYVYLFN